MSFPSLSRVFFVRFSHRKIQNWNVKINKRKFSYYNHSFFHPRFGTHKFFSVAVSFLFLNLFVFERKKWGSKRLKYLFFPPLFCNFHGKKVSYEEKKKFPLQKVFFLAEKIFKLSGAIVHIDVNLMKFCTAVVEGNSFGEDAEAFHPSNSSYFIFHVLSRRQPLSSTLVSIPSIITQSHTLLLISPLHKGFTDASYHLLLHPFWQ